MAGLKAVILGGKTGMLGRALLDAALKMGLDALPLGREDYDMLDADSLARMVDREEPDLLFNAIAYTNVDKAEEEEDQAQAVNACLPGNLARLAKAHGFQLIHFSTDFVFDGKNRSTPYLENDEPNPLCAYGRTKLAGERKILEVDPDRFCIVRTAWLFGPGRKNFVKTMLTLAQDRDELRVVHDQIGSPTYTPDLASLSLALAELDVRGIFHAANSGVASWCELAAEAISLGGFNTTVTAIPTEEYPTPAARPAYSVLDTTKLVKITGVTPRPWVQALRDYVYLMSGTES
ncbi:MAG: dTDP-4-dehydrorhamnose reductase [Desulfovibrio sp.]|nr:MAG: dTDP-4-dehydrorhamnose reductase [Desulfovibrio sp.]